MNFFIIMMFLLFVVILLVFVYGFYIVFVVILFFFVLWKVDEIKGCELEDMIGDVCLCCGVVECEGSL